MSSELKKIHLSACIFNSVPGILWLVSQGAITFSHMVLIFMSDFYSHQGGKVRRKENGCETSTEKGTQ